MPLRIAVVVLVIRAVGIHGLAYGTEETIRSTHPSMDTTVAWDYQLATSLSTEHNLGYVVTTSVLDVNPRSEENGGLLGSTTPETYAWRWRAVTWSWWIVLQTMIAILGFLGNCLVAVVVFQRRDQNHSMDTLIGALAVADALTSLFILPWPEASVIHDTWVGRLYCKVMYRNIFRRMSMFASIYTMVAISIDRYLAIAHPFLFHRLVSKEKVNTVIMLVWLTVAGVVVGGEMFPVRYDRSSRKCKYFYASPEANLVFGYYQFVAKLVLPTVILLVTQVLIARVLYRQSKRFSGDPSSKSSGNSSHLVARKRIINMMLIVIILYVICWGPVRFFFLGINLGFVPYSYRNTPLHRLLIINAFINSCVNPFIYAARHQQFRVALKRLLTGRKEGSRTRVFGEDEPVNSKVTESLNIPSQM